MRFFLKFFSAFLLVSNIAFAGEIATRKPQKPTIVTSINPIYQIALAITQDKINTSLIINPSFSEHDYQLKKTDVEFVNKADLIFYVSDDLENNFLKLVTNYNKKDQAFELVKISDLKLLQKRNDAKRIDPHIWLNPQNGLKIAQLITQKISEIDPVNAAKYQKNLERFTKEVLIAEKTIQMHLKETKNQGYIFYHDGYQYFENYFDVRPLKVVAYNHNSELTVGAMKEIDSLIKSNQVKCIFGEPQDEKNSAIKLAQNYKIKFAILDLIGTKENHDKKSNGYSILLINMSDDMVSCLRQ